MAYGDCFTTRRPVDSREHTSSVAGPPSAALIERAHRPGSFDDLRDLPSACLAPAATPVILYGESGTGKTFFAEYIHQLSGRSGGFHAFSVGTVAPQLALDELFGHVQGAYTDARTMRTGRIGAG